MNVKPVAWLLVLVLAAVMGAALLAQGHTTGNAVGAVNFQSGGAVLSAFAAVVAIGVLIVAGLQRTEEKE